MRLTAILLTNKNVEIPLTARPEEQRGASNLMETELHVTYSGCLCQLPRPIYK